MYKNVDARYGRGVLQEQSVGKTCIVQRFVFDTFDEFNPPTLG